MLTIEVNPPPNQMDQNIKLYQSIAKFEQQEPTTTVKYKRKANYAKGAEAKVSNFKSDVTKNETPYKVSQRFDKL